MYMACSKAVLVARCASEKPLVFSSTCLYQSSSPSLPSRNSSRDLMTPSSPVPAGYMVTCRGCHSHRPFCGTCPSLAGGSALTSSPASSPASHCGSTAGSAVAFCFCLPQTSFHTSDSRRRLFPQILDSRAEDNNPTTPTAPASPSRHTKKDQNHKIRLEPYHKEFLVPRSLCPC